MIRRQGALRGAVVFVATTTALLVANSTVHAQLPATRLTAVTPAGANPGGKLEVKIAGVDLDDCNQLLFSHAGITAKLKMAEATPFDKQPTPVANTFEVNVAAGTPLGVYEVRAGGKYGVSNPRAFMIGDLMEVPETEPNNTIEEAALLEGPILVNGGSNPAADVDYYRFQLQAGQNVVIDCRARRIDSDFEPNLVLYGPSGRQVAAGGRVAGGDVQLQFTAKTTGLHSIRLSDALFRGGENFYYRLSIGVLTRIDFIFPPAGQPGNQQFTIFGRNLPGGQNAGLSSGGHPLQKLTVTVPLPGGAATEQLNYRWFVNSESTGLAGQEYRLKGPASFSNPVLVGYATVPVVLEKEANNEPPQAQQIKPPCEVAGQFYPRRDEDWVQFEAKKGDVFWVEVVSQRLGLDTDPRMLVMQVTKDKEGVEQLKLLSNVDDGGSADGADFNIRTDDPSYRFEAPDDGVYKIQVRDEYSRFRADPKNVYRLCIRRPQPDFRLAAGPSHGKGGLLLRRGGRTAIRVVAFRRDGFDGPIEVAVTGLPAGVTCPPVVIGPARHAAMLVLSAAANAAPGVAKLQVSGKSVRDGKPLTRTARLCAATHPERPQQGQIQRRPPQLRLTDALVVTVTEEVSPVTLAAGDSKVLEMSRAARVKVPFTLARDGFKNGNIQITAADLPPNVQVANVAANGATAKGEIEIRLNQNTPLGRYTFFLNGQVQNLKYARNPEAATKAAARKKEVDAINADAKTKQTAAQKAKADADKNAAAAATAATAAQQAKTKADQAVTAAQQVQKAAATKRSQAQAALAKKADDAALKAADAAAQKALVDADAKLKTAQAAAVKAAQDMTAAQTKNTSAAAAKKVADEAFTKADEFAKAAVQAAAAATKRATDTANAAKPANRNLRIPSTPITIDVAPAPIRMKQPAAASVVQGAKAEAPIAVERLFSFADPVTLAIQAPGGVAGISIPNATIAKGQTAGKLAISAAANATPGKHQYTVRGSVRLNNITLTVEQPLELTVQPAPPAAKK